MNAFTWSGSILALLTYYPLWKQIRSGEAKQNLLTWALWGTLDAVVAATIIAQKGSFLLPITYAAGSSVTVIFIWKAGNKAAWTWFETMVASLTVASMVLWYFSGGKVATIASTTAMVIAGVPQFIDACRRPQEMPMLPFFSYFVANCLSAAGGKSWAIEERFYPVGAAIFCFSIVVVSARKYWMKPVLIQSASE